jgi:hypothetical protein
MQARRRPPPAGARTAAVLALVAVLSLGLPGAAAADIVAVDGDATGVTAILVVPGSGRVELVASRRDLPAGTGSASPVTDTVEAVDRLDAVRTGRLHASTAGTPGPDGFVDSSARTADLLIGPAAAPLVEVGAACSACAADGSGTTADTSVVDLRVGGRPIAVPTAPNSVVVLAGIGTLHVNEQVALGSAPSAGVRVTALRIELTGPGGVTGTITIAQSVCRLAAAEVAMPTTALGGVLLTGLVAIAFAAVQRRRAPGGVS